jgi:hypothetical protein
MGQPIMRLTWKSSQDRCVYPQCTATSAEIHPRMSRPEERIRLRHHPRARRIVPPRPRADLAPDAQQLSVPGELDDWHAKILV